MGDETASSAASRQAAELILQDERLTADLEDREAEALLRWALSAAEQVVAIRLQRGEALDREAVVEAVRPVRQVTRAINDLVAAHTDMEQGEFLAILLVLIDSACQLIAGIEASGKPVVEPPSPHVPPL